MTLTIHQASVPVFVQGLKGLKGVLTKAAAHAEAKNLDPDSLLKARLYPDMFPLLRQVQIATDFAKGCAARLAGEEVPAWDDVETGFADLIARVDRAIAYVEGLDRAKFVELYNSFSVQSKSRRATQLQDAYKVQGVPAIGIAGRCYTDGTLAGHMDRALQVTDYLVAELRTGR